MKIEHNTTRQTDNFTNDRMTDTFLFFYVSFPNSKITIITFVVTVFVKVPVPQKCFRLNKKCIAQMTNRHIRSY